jgi:hypothetical protein
MQPSFDDIWQFATVIFVLYRACQAEITSFVVSSSESRIQIQTQLSRLVLADGRWLLHMTVAVDARTQIYFMTTPYFIALI